MGQKDVISKHLVMRIAVDLAVHLLKLDIKIGELKLLPTEQERVEDRRADLVAQITQKEYEYILHVEIQNDNHSEMDLRMLRYYTDIGFANPNIPIHQYVIYIGKAKLRMPDCRNDEGLDYRYTIINMHDVDYQVLLNQNTPDAIVLAILGDFKQHSPREAVENIVRRLHDLLKSSPQRFREYFEMLERLSENRNLEKYINEVKDMITEIDVEKLASFKWGVEKEKERWEEKMVQIVKQLLIAQSPEMVSKLTNMSLDEVIEIKKKINKED